MNIESGTSISTLYYKKKELFEVYLQQSFQQTCVCVLMEGAKFSLMIFLDLQLIVLWDFKNELISVEKFSLISKG